MTSRASNNIPLSLRKIWQQQEDFGRASTEAVMPEGRAIVCHDTYENGGWKMENVSVRKPGEGELLVEMVASGVCHTDALIGGIPGGASPAAFYPRVLGHEGAGYVKEVGPGVSVAQLGDPVLLSFAFCDRCEICKSGHRSNCISMTELNFASQNTIFSGTSEGGKLDISGSFFGQSSFASLSVVRQCSVVNVKGIIKDRKELELFAPLGCGIQTGSGTVINAAEATPQDSIVVMGLGGVGLSAVMGAKIQGCSTIIGVDRVESRLKLAKELGATHKIDSSKLPKGKQLGDVIKDLTSGVGPTITIDTTGVPTLINAGVEFTRNKGKIIQVGSSPFNFKLEIEVFSYMLTGKQFFGAIEGSAYPPEYVPKMIQWQVSLSRRSTYLEHPLTEPH